MAIKSPKIGNFPMISKEDCWSEIYGNTSRESDVIPEKQLKHRIYCTSYCGLGEMKAQHIVP
jgi:hypothetical protein